LNLYLPQPAAGIGVYTMEEPTVLRTARVGGFVKEDVMTYLDELNSKIISLEEDLKKAKGEGSASAADSQELIKARNQVDNLQEKLNASNNALRAAKKENEELQKKLDESQKIIAQLRSGGAAPAQGGAQGNAQTAAALEAAKREIDTLRNKLRAAEEKAAAAPAQGGAQAQGGNAASEAELAKVKQEISKITAELEAKTKELAEKDSKLTQIAKENESAIAKKDAEISKLNDEITDLKENGGGMIPSSFDMGALFTEAQKTAGKITIEAQRNADKVTKEANEKADSIVKEANIEAEKTINNANTAAETCIKEANDQAKATVEQANVQAKTAVDQANAQAKATVDQANAQAKRTVDEANAHADKVNEMSETVRKMLLNEIESVNTKFSDINSVLARLSTQANDRMSEAQLIVGEARKAVDNGEAGKIVKKEEAPRADFKPVDAPKAIAPEAPAAAPKATVTDPFAGVGSSQSYNSGVGANSYNKPASQAPAQQQSAQQPPKQPAKKSTSFNFDMAELLKAAEEEAAKESNE